MPLAVHNNILTSNTEVQNMENHTPAKMAAKTSSSTKVGRRFTEEEKAQLLENFDLESMYFIALIFVHVLNPLVLQLRTG